MLAPPAHHGMYLCPLSPSLSFLHRNAGVFLIRKDGVVRGEGREGWLVGFWFWFLFFISVPRVGLKLRIPRSRVTFSTS